MSDITTNSIMPIAGVHTHAPTKKTDTDTVTEDGTDHTGNTVHTDLDDTMKVNDTTAGYSPVAHALSAIGETVSETIGSVSRSLWAMSPSFDYKRLFRKLTLREGLHRRIQELEDDTANLNNTLQDLKKEVQFHRENENHRQAENRQYRIEMETARRELQSLRSQTQAQGGSINANSNMKDEAEAGTRVATDEWGIPVLDQHGQPFTDLNLQRSMLISHRNDINQMIDSIARDVQLEIAKERGNATDEITRRAMGDSHRIYQIKNDLMDPTHLDHGVERLAERIVGDLIGECFERYRNGSSVPAVLGYHLTPTVSYGNDGLEVSVTAPGERVWQDRIDFPTFHTPLARGYFAEAEMSFERKTIDKLTESVISQLSSRLGDDSEGRWQADTRRVVGSYLTSTLEGERINRGEQGRSGQGHLESVSVEVNPGPCRTDGKTFSMDWKDARKYFANIPPPVDLSVDPDFSVHQGELRRRSPGKLFTKRAKTFMGEEYVVQTGGGA